MKRILITFVICCIAIFTTQAQNENLGLTFANAEITSDGLLDFYEVDVIAVRTSAADFRLGSSQFYLDYNTAAFGENIDGATVEFTYPDGSIFDFQGFSGSLNVWSDANIVNNTNGTISIANQQVVSGGSYPENITLVPNVLGHLKIEMIDTNESPDVCFNLLGNAFDDQFFTACGPFANDFQLSDCTGINAGLQIMNYDGSDCSGGLIMMDLCDDETTWNGTMWSNNPPTSMVRAIIAGMYNTSMNGNIEACELLINITGSVNVAADGFVRVQNDITVEGSLTVAHTANVVQVNDDAVVTNTSGAISVNVMTPNVDTRDFMILGSPMDVETREGVWADAFNVQFFSPELFDPFDFAPEDGVIFNFQSMDLDVWSPKSGVLAPGEGYLVFPQTGINAPGGVFSYDYNDTAATLNNGVITRALNFNETDGQLSSPNILSNPYASAIDAQLFMDANGEIDAVYFWEHGAGPSLTVPGPNSVNFTMRDVSVYNETGGVMAASGAGTIPNGVIATAQGFGVFASGAGDAVFNNSMRLIDGNTTLRTNEVTKNRVWLQLEDLNYGERSNVLVGFLEGATSGVDAKYDNPRQGNSISLYSHIGDDLTNGYLIQGREAFNQEKEVLLGFQSHIEEAVEFRISLSDFDGAGMTASEIYLEDLVTGIITDLKNDSYEFTTDASLQPGRFRLFFDRNVLGTTNEVLNEISIYPSPADKVLNIVSPRTQVQRISIYDIRGRLVVDQEIDDSQLFTIDVDSLFTGVYAITINTQEGNLTKRFIKE